MPIETFTAQVESIKNLTHDVRQLDLRLIEPKTITFKPGQFISFEVPHPQTGHLVTRAYSIASQPSRSDVITLLFNLVPGGPGSTYLFHLKEGDKTHFKGPAGNFYLREDPGRELLFIASGTGIAPIRSMLLANAERPDPRPATLFWGLRGQRDLYYQEELAELTRADADPHGHHDALPPRARLVRRIRPRPAADRGADRLGQESRRLSLREQRHDRRCHIVAPEKRSVPHLPRKILRRHRLTGGLRGKHGSPLVSCARATRTIRRCSFDARSRGSTRLPLKGGEGEFPDARSRRPIGPPATTRNERAWKEHLFYKVNTCTGSKTKSRL